jgi:tripartite tricarboxylate transporter TctB family protein
MQQSETPTRALFGTSLGDYVPAFAAAVAAAAYLTAAYGYSADARAAPLLIGWSVIVLAALDIASRTKTPLGLTLMRWLNPVAGRPRAGHAHAAYPLTRQVAAIAWIGGFVAAFALVGALYAIPLYVAAATRWRGGRPWLVCALSAACTLGGVWLLFSRLLRLELYPGLLFGGM